MIQNIYISELLRAICRIIIQLHLLFLYLEGHQLSSEAWRDHAISTSSPKLLPKSRDIPGSLVMDLKQLVLDLCLNPKHTKWIAPLIVLGDVLLCVLIIWKIPCELAPRHLGCPDKQCIPS